MAAPSPITKIWELDLRAHGACGRRGVEIARQAIAGSGNAGQACANFREATGITVSPRQLKEISALSAKPTVAQLRRRLTKRLHEDRYARQFSRAAGSNSVRTVGGGLPSLGSR